MKWSTFIAGLVVALVVMLGFGVVIAALNHGTSRPEGVAENWLTAVGDTTRKGVEADARKRAEKIGSLDLVNRTAGGVDVAPKDRLVSTDTNGRAAFADIEVGKAVRDVPIDNSKTCPACSQPYDPLLGKTFSVAFRVHTRRGDATAAVTGRLVLAKLNDRGTPYKATQWHVIGAYVGDTAGLPKLPSEGGPAPSKAPVSLWIGALVGAAVLGVITTSLVRLAGRAAPAAATA